MFFKIAKGMISHSTEGEVKTAKQNLTLLDKLLFFFVDFFFSKQIFNIVSNGLVGFFGSFFDSLM